jgi:hypothetical protein
MKKLITYLIVFTFLFRLEAFAQWPGDVKPVSGKKTFASRRELKVEERRRSSEVKQQQKLKKNGERDAVKRFIYKKYARKGKKGKRARAPKRK